MWTALVRQLAVFLFTRRGKRIAIGIGVALLCFLTALLTDSKMFLTAGVTGAITAIIVVTLIAQYFRGQAKQRERARREAEQALRRAATSQARGEKLDRAKSAFTNAAQAASSGATDVVTRAGTGLAGAKERLNFWRRSQKPSRRTHLPQ
jgi:hypothetical protein